MPLFLLSAFRQSDRSRSPSRRAVSSGVCVVCRGACGSARWRPRGLLQDFQSWTLAAVWITASVTPFRSTTTWRLEPCLPLSVGFLVCWPPRGRLRWMSPKKPSPSRSRWPVRDGPKASCAQPLPHPRLVPFFEASPEQQVIPEPQPISSWGNISQGMALLRTNRMPVRTAWSSIRSGLSPLGLGGSSGSRVVSVEVCKSEGR